MYAAGGDPDTPTTSSTYQFEPRWVPPMRGEATVWSPLCVIVPAETVLATRVIAKLQCGTAMSNGPPGGRAVVVTGAERKAAEQGAGTGDDAEGSTN